MRLTILLQIPMHLILDLGLLLPIRIPIRFERIWNPDTGLCANLARSRIHHWHHLLSQTIPLLLARFERRRFLDSVRYTKLGVLGLLLKRIDCQSILGVFVGRRVRNVILVLGLVRSLSLRPRGALLAVVLVERIGVFAFLRSDDLLEGGQDIGVVGLR